MENSDRLHQLERLIRAGSIEDRRRALDELAQMPAESVVPLLEALSQSENFQIRRVAVMGLGNHCTDQAFQVLTDILAREKDDNVIAEAANSLFEFGERAIPLLADLFIQQPYWLTRQTILAILMEAHCPEVLLSVVRLGLEDPTQTVKETAILALAPLMNGPFETAALEILTPLASSESWRDRWRSATTLSLSGHLEAQKLLAGLRQDPNHYVVAATLEGSITSDP
ncbi:MAG: HEAT repeat domain-containing protein [Leptolyngbya sp. SIOISBB]|nr:HEAT repeat domain-containing protein [Leptolyngbya sp. SIOISBB]